MKREKALHKDFNGANSGPVHAPEFLIKEAALHDDFNGANSGPQHVPGIITFTFLGRLETFIRSILHWLEENANTTFQFQSMMNARLSHRRFKPCWPINMTPTIPNKSLHWFLAVQGAEIFHNHQVSSFQKVQLTQKRAYHDDSNDTPQPTWVEPC